jgi:hypothetical protein
MPYKDPANQAAYRAEHREELNAKRRATRDYTADWLAKKAKYGPEVIAQKCREQAERRLPREEYLKTCKTPEERRVANSKRHKDKYRQTIPSSQKQHYVYGLIDPSVSELFYVGCTISPATRLQAHHSNNPSMRAVQERVTTIVAKGFEPSMIILEQTPDKFREELWISRLAPEHPLINKYLTT